MLLLEGQKVGPYQIVSRIGQGGMATVYQAYHPQLDRFVAIKMMQSSFLVDDHFRTRFEREAKIVGSLEHPNILPVYDFAQFQGQPYLVMKFIDGASLKTVLHDGALELDDIMLILPPIASALDYAHMRGVLHRDIKPSNILLDKKGTPYLTDFGLARAVVSGESNFSQDMFIGTPYYVSPEQGMGERDLTPRSDLYSFGVVLYELLTGRVPFDSGSTFAIIHDHIYRPLPLPSSINPALTSDIEAVLLRGLAKDPRERYESAASMVNALREAVSASNLHSVKISSGLIPTETSISKRPLPSDTSILPREKTVSTFWRRRTLIAGAAAAAFVVVIAGVIIWGRGGETAASLPPPGVVLYPVPDLGLDGARAALGQARDNPISYLAVARAYLEEGRDEPAEDSIFNGAAYSDDLTVYFMTAAEIARTLHRADVAFLMYSQALVYAETGDNFPWVRAEAGEYLYNTATNRGMLDSLRMRRLNSDARLRTSAVVGAMIARALLTDGRDRIAEIALNRVFTLDGDLPEAHLVMGELQNERGLAARARREWDLARAADNAPMWIQERAAQLINALD